MNTSEIRADARTVLQARGLSVKQMADQSGMDYGSLWRFLNQGTNLNTDSLSKLWPVIYGDQRPVPVLDRPPAAEASSLSLEALENRSPS